MLGVASRVSECSLHVGDVLTDYLQLSWRNPLFLDIRLSLLAIALVRIMFFSGRQIGILRPK